MRHLAVACVVVGSGATGACKDTGAINDAAVGDANGDAAIVDADPRLSLVPRGPFEIGPGGARQDEDPTLAVSPEGTLIVLWYSDRGSAAAGRMDKQVYATRSNDGIEWSSPVAVSAGADWGFAPSLSTTEQGVVASWWNWKHIPDGCSPGVDCTGASNRILARRTTDVTTWTSSIETVTDGLGDWLPSVVEDLPMQRTLVYFAAVARRADGTIDTSQTTSRLFVAIHENGGWQPPIPLVGVNADPTHQSYPFVVRRSDGTFAMTWTRFVAADGDFSRVYSEPSTETMLATSADGISWTDIRTVSEGAGGFVDVFPSLHVDHAGMLHVLWVTTDGAPTGQVIELPFAGAYPADRTVRSALAGYSPRIVATATPDVFLAAWVQGAEPMQRVQSMLFIK
ncbi:MAG: sialidase family protein [Kofleriaceae bacterium]